MPCRAMEWLWLKEPVIYDDASFHLTSLPEKVTIHMFGCEPTMSASPSRADILSAGIKPKADVVQICYGNYTKSKSMTLKWEPLASQGRSPLDCYCNDLI